MVRNDSDKLSKLKSAHELYAKTYKYLWSIGAIMFIAGGLMMGGGLYASYLNASINIASNYGNAMESLTGYRCS